MRNNKDKMELKYTMNHGSGLRDAIFKFPGILVPIRDVLEEVIKSVREELDGDGDGGVFISGNFWTGKFVSPSPVFPTLTILTAI